jgi:hypothetical protein
MHIKPIDHKPQFRALRSLVALAEPTVRAMVLEDLLNRAAHGEFALADRSVMSRVDTSLASLPERLGPSAEAVAEAERRRVRFLETYAIAPHGEGGIRADMKGASITGFLMDADQICRLIHQKPLVHHHEFQSWIDCRHPAITTKPSDTLEVIPGERSISGGHQALIFTTGLSDVMAAHAAHLVLTGASLFQGCRAKALDGVVDYFPFGLYIPRYR